MTETTIGVKHGEVTQKFSSGSCGIWCKHDQLLYMYHLEPGGRELELGDQVQFTRKDEDTYTAILVPEEDID